ncbi:MAG: LemA family protein [Anaerolineae bacterium]|nr:LemA family protein [Phycisphaerae bacterium]
MSTPLIIALAIGAVVILGALVLASIYNRLVTLRQRNLNAFSQIDVQLKRRYDLIPNLVEAVKGYMAHERGTLEEVIRARNTAIAAAEPAARDPRNSAAIQGMATAENALTAALSRMMVLSEGYPQLKADQSTGRLMEELSSTENRVAFARQAYNDSVMQYNTARQTFPTAMIAPAFGFTEASLFQIDDAKQREVVKVSLQP